MALSLTVLLDAAPTNASAATAAARPADAHSAHTSRRVNPRTGRLPPALADLVKAAKQHDRGALARLADRIGPAHLGDAIAGRDTALSQAALAAAPLARGGVLLLGTVADQLGAPETGRVIAAATALASLLDGSSPAELEEWDVAPDTVSWACWGLHWIAAKTDARESVRLAALDAIASAAPSCGGAADLVGLTEDKSPAIRRAAALVATMQVPTLRPPSTATIADRQRDAVLNDAITDSDARVSAAATAAACRVEERSVGKRGKPQPPPSQAVASARALATSVGTPPEDTIEMLDCLAAAGTAADRGLLDELERRPLSPLRDRAMELRPEIQRGKP